MSAAIDKILAEAEQAGQRGWSFTSWWIGCVCRRRERVRYILPDIYEAAKTAHERGRKGALLALNTPSGPRSDVQTRRKVARGSLPILPNGVERPMRRADDPSPFEAILLINLLVTFFVVAAPVLLYCIRGDGTSARLARRR